MHDDALKQLVEMEDLIDSGKLSKNAIPRLFYLGHKIIGVKENPNIKLHCVGCETSFDFCESLKLRENPDNDWATGYECPYCKKGDVYDITENKEEITWECKDCKHQWTAYNGQLCPNCKSHRN